MKAELLSYFGNDLMVVNAARVSYGKNKTEFDEKDAKLIKYLYDHKHTSVFRHPQLQFRLEMPIFVERQVFKHQVGISANCLHGDTLIRFKHSSGANADVSIKDLYDKFSNGRPHQNTEKDKAYQQSRIRNRDCRVLNEETGVFTVGHVKNIIYSGKKKLYKIILQDGKELVCTDKHRIYTDGGWKTIEDGLSTASFVGVNGLKFAGTGGYQDFNKLESCRISGMSVAEMSEHFQCSYHTIRKWLKIHKLQFTVEETYFKPGHSPWNAGKSGYTLDISLEVRERKSELGKLHNPSGAASRLWRGGITKERDLIAVWTGKQAKHVHKKFNYTCQNCGRGEHKLVAHHIIPAAQDISKAYVFDNLITVCEPCHYEIHRSIENEQLLAAKVLNEDFVIFSKEKRFGLNKQTRKVKVHFVKVKSIEYFGEDDTYDIEMEAPHHNFVANGIVVHNSISGRYVDFSDTCYKIEKFRKQSSSSKQGSEGLLEDDENDEANYLYGCAMAKAKECYDELLKLGVSKEQARAVLPMALNTQCVWTGSLLAFFHLCNLRLKPDTQQETRELVQMMLDQVKNLEGSPFKYSLEAFGY